MEKNLTVSEFVASVGSTMGSGGKEMAITRACQQNPWLKEVLKMTYDPFMQYYLKKGFPKPTKTTDWLMPFDKEFWEYKVKPLLIKLTNRELTKQQITDILSPMLGRLTESDQEMLKRIIFKDLRCGIGARTINRAVGDDLIPVPDTQLCKAWDPSILTPEVTEWYATPKLNGLRGRYTLREGKFQFLTREDYPLKGFDILEKQLADLCYIFDIEMVDGEVFSFDLPFQTIMSVARGEKEFSPEDKAKLQFHIFNIRKRGERFSCTKDMVNELNRISKIYINQYMNILVLEYSVVPNNPTNIEDLCREFTAQGYEGVVLRHPDVAWEPGKRNTHLMKYKIFYEADLIVTQVLKGAEGKKWADSVAALRCAGIIKAKKIKVGDHELLQPVNIDEQPIDGEEFVNVPVKVEASCSSCTDAERAELTKMGDELVGRTAEVKFQSFCDHPITGGNGAYSLQFPVFLKFKDVI